MQKSTFKLIHIDWQGPFTLKELNLLTNDSHDYGLYQIYGKHIVYGKDVLLYIGKADLQTIGKRISQENWWDTNDSNHLKVYVGRLAGERTPDENNWSKEIDLAEKLLIYVHKPVYNSRSLTSIPDTELQDIHILNWGDHRDLLPEISGLRWTSKLDNMKYEIYRYTNTK
jgi:hypothetical protein